MKHDSSNYLFSAAPRLGSFWFLSIQTASTDSLLDNPKAGHIDAFGKRFASGELSYLETQYLNP